VSKNLDQMQAENPNFVPSGSDIVHVFSGGEGFATTIDKLAVLINGFTVDENTQPSVGRTVVFPVALGGAVAPIPAGPLVWAEVEVDTDGFFSSMSPDRFVTPAGIKLIELFFSFRHSDTATPIATPIRFHIFKNGNTSNPVATGEATVGATITSRPIDVTLGDYFQVVFEQETGGTEDGCYFGLKVLERVAI